MKITVTTISEQHQVPTFSDISTILISFHKLPSLVRIKFLLSNRLTANLTMKTTQISTIICLIYQQILQLATSNALLTTKISIIMCRTENNNFCIAYSHSTNYLKAPNISHKILHKQQSQDKISTTKIKSTIEAYPLLTKSKIQAKNKNTSKKKKNRPPTQNPPNYPKMESLAPSKQNFS